ncbi:MAG: hypothetical protein A2X32_05565 [Elusimicrobia bacterium GWC2_64_44]|nr:MAG: hypothetical protein A2X32_05565 [Elusimicrobia bacterium GWC2_64_44]
MKRIFFAAVFALSCTEARAFHPLIGEDTAFLGKDVKQAELGFEHAVSRAGADTYSNSGSAEFSYGLFERVDVLLSAGWHGWTSLGLSESGLSDVSLEVKFPVAEKAGWTLALKPGFSLPAGDESRSLGAGEGGVWLYGIAGRQAGPWQFYLNAVYLLNRNSVNEEENIFRGSAAAVREVLPKVMVSAELGAGTNKDKSSASHPVSGVLGLIWSPYPTLDLDAGFKAGLTDSADDVGLLLGLTLRM